jgi:hypothetical protein
MALAIDRFGRDEKENNDKGNGRTGNNSPKRKKAKSRRA